MYLCVSECGYLVINVNQDKKAKFLIYDDTARRRRRLYHAVKFRLAGQPQQNAHPGSIFPLLSIFSMPFRRTDCFVI